MYLETMLISDPGAHYITQGVRDEQGLDLALKQFPA